MQLGRKPKFIAGAVAALAMLGGAFYITTFVAPIDRDYVIGPTYIDSNCARRFYTAEIDPDKLDTIKTAYIEMQGSDSRELRFYDFTSDRRIVVDSPNENWIGDSSE